MMLDGVDFVSFDGGSVGEHNGVGILQISEISAKQSDFFHGAMSFCKV